MKSFRDRRWRVSDLLKQVAAPATRQPRRSSLRIRKQVQFYGVLPQTPEPSPRERRYRARVSISLTRQIKFDCVRFKKTKLPRRRNIRRLVRNRSIPNIMSTSSSNTDFDDIPSDSDSDFEPRYEKGIWNEDSESEEFEIIDLSSDDSVDSIDPDPIPLNLPVETAKLDDEPGELLLDLDLNMEVNNSSDEELSEQSALEQSDSSDDNEEEIAEPLTVEQSESDLTNDADDEAPESSGAESSTHCKNYADQDSWMLSVEPLIPCEDEEENSQGFAVEQSIYNLTKDLSLDIANGEMAEAGELSMDITTNSFNDNVDLADVSCFTDDSVTSTNGQSFERTVDTDPKPAGMLGDASSSSEIPKAPTADSFDHGLDSVLAMDTDQQADELVDPIGSNETSKDCSVDIVDADQGAAGLSIPGGEFMDTDTSGVLPSSSMDAIEGSGSPPSGDVVVGDEPDLPIRSVVAPAPVMFIPDYIIDTWANPQVMYPVCRRLEPGWRVKTMTSISEALDEPAYLMQFHGTDHQRYWVLHSEAYRAFPLFLQIYLHTSGVSFNNPLFDVHLRTDFDPNDPNKFEYKPKAAEQV